MSSGGSYSTLIGWGVGAGLKPSCPGSYSLSQTSLNIFVTPQYRRHLACPTVCRLVPYLCSRSFIINGIHIATKYRGERDRRIGNALWLFGATDGQIDTPLNGAAHPPAPISRALSPQYASIWHAWSGPSRGWPPTPRRWRFSVRIRTAHRSFSQQGVYAHVPTCMYSVCMRV